MASKNKFLEWFKKGNRLPFLMVFCLLLVAHLFIFRGIVAQIPDILSGKAVLVREELVPFFSGSQYWPDDTSALTGSDEIRVAYSFWTSWVRYYTVLPFAIVIMNTLSAFILFYAFYRIGTNFTEGKHRKVLILAAFLATIPIHFILLYAKITHFYSLILGFSTLALSLSFFFEQMFFKEKISKSNVVITSLLVLFNPAIHYHVIFYTVLVLAVLIHLAVTALIRRPMLKKELKKDLCYSGIIIALSAIPYALFILLATTATSAAQSIPVNYDMITYTSVPLSSLLAFDIAAQTDMFRYGEYLPFSPRFFMMSIPAIIAIGLFMKSRLKSSPRMRTFTYSTVTLLIVSGWMSLGYTSAASFHSILASSMMALSKHSGFMVDKLLELVGVFINILRFPHRFEFIYFYVGGVLLMLALFKIYYWVRLKDGPVAAAVFVMLIIVAPMLLTTDYRQVFLSGNFGGFLQPYAIGKDLKNIRSDLASEKDVRLFVMPTMESGRELTDTKGDQRFNFIDKFFIFYLGKPTEYYGLGATMEQKIKAFLVYRAISDGDDWWQDVLADNLGANYILYPKQAQARTQGLVYMPNVEKKIGQALQKSDRYEKVYDGKEYALYKLKNQNTPQTPTLLDMQWTKLQQYLANRQKNQFYVPAQLLESIPQRFTLVTDNPERSFYDLYTTRKRAPVFSPDHALAPFADNVTSSSFYMTQTLSMYTLNNPRDKYNRTNESIPTLTNVIRPNFVITEGKDSRTRISFNVKDDQQQRLLLRGASRASSLKVKIDGRIVEFKKLPGDPVAHDHLDFTYFTANVSLKPGMHSAVIGDAKYAVVVESLSVLRKAEIPKDFSNISDIDISFKIVKDNQYSVELKD